MSEMTATRMIRAGILAVIVLAWLASAVALWATEVPTDLRLPDVSASRYFKPPAVEQFEHHDRVLRALGLGALVAELVGLALVAARPPRVRGPVAARAAQLAVAAALAAFLARLPFSLAILWWQRHT